MTDSLGYARNAVVSDAELLAISSAGNHRAFSALFRRHEPVVSRVALSIMRTPWDAEEVVGSAYLELWRKRGSIHTVDESVLPWLLASVSLLAKNHMRGRLRYQRLLHRLPFTGVQEDHSDEVARLVDSHFLRRDVRAVFSELSTLDANVAVLRLIHELSTREVSAILSVPEGTVKSRLARAKVRLRERLRDHAPGLEFPPP